MADELREKIAQAVFDGMRADDTCDMIADAILALLPKPTATDDVKALIEEARHAQGAWHGWQGDEYPEGTKHVSLIARLAAALSDADAAGYARGIEDAAHRLTILPPTGSIPKGGVAREAWLAGHTSALINAQGAIRALKDPT